MIENRLIRPEVQWQGYNLEKTEVNYFYDPSSNIGRYAVKSSFPNMSGVFEYNFRRRTSVRVDGAIFSPDSPELFVLNANDYFDTGSEIGYPELIEIAEVLEECCSINYTKLEQGKLYICRSTMPDQFEYKNGKYTRKHNNVDQSYVLFRFDETEMRFDVEDIPYIGIKSSETWENEDGIGVIGWNDENHEPKIIPTKDASADLEDIAFCIYPSIPEAKRDFYAEYAGRNHLFFEVSDEEAELISNLVAPIWPKI